MRSSATAGDGSTTIRSAWKRNASTSALPFDGIKALTGTAPVGWFNGRPSIETRRLVVEHGGFLYDRDYLGDELPFWVKYGKRDHLVIPFSFETNDNRFDQNQRLQYRRRVRQIPKRLLRPFVRRRRGGTRS